MSRTTITGFARHETPELDNQDGFLTVWLNRPQAPNAISRERMTELPDPFNTLRITTSNCAVIPRGRGSVFFADGDLKRSKSIFQGDQTRNC